MAACLLLTDFFARNNTPASYLFGQLSWCWCCIFSRTNYFNCNFSFREKKIGWHQVNPRRLYLSCSTADSRMDRKAQIIIPREESQLVAGVHGNNSWWWNVRDILEIAHLRTCLTICTSSVTKKIAKSRRKTPRARGLQSVVSFNRSWCARMRRENKKSHGPPNFQNTERHKNHQQKNRDTETESTKD